MPTAHHPRGAEPGYAGIAVLCIVYAALAGMALWWGIDAYTPCVSNFEGGCSMGKGLLAIGSAIFAAIGAGVAVGVGALLSAKLQTRPFAKPAGIVLCGVPLLYTLFTLKAVFIG